MERRIDLHTFTIIVSVIVYYAYSEKTDFSLIDDISLILISPI